MKSTRTTRDEESRVNEMLLNYNMEYVSPLTPPPGAIRDGYVGCWALKEIKGQPTRDIERLYAKGWTLVPADRCPGGSIDPLKRNPMSSQYFSYSDVMLMERPKILDDREKASLYALNASKMRMPHVADDPNYATSSQRSIDSF